MERSTTQRRAILAAINVAGRPLTPEEILASAQAEVPKMGIATVYRNVKALEYAGEIAGVELPGEGRRFEAAGLKHHHHFHCRACGKVFDLTGCTGGFQSLVPRGFRLEDHEVILYGRCKACA